MLTVVKNNFKFLLQSIKCNLLASKEYRTSFVVQTVFMFINNGFFLIFWGAIFKINDNNINGVIMRDILYLWSISPLAYGIAYFLFGGVDNICNNIITGKFDTYLLYPKHPLISAVTSKTDFSACGDLIYGLVIGLFAVSFSPGKYILLILYSILGAVFFIASGIMIQMLSVWFGDIREIAEKYKFGMLVQFSIYPEVIFKKWIKILLYTVVPVAYTTYVPFKLIEYFSIQNLFLFLLAIITYIALVLFVYNKAIKYYESGNAIGLME